nr:hypothetical protein [Tanacetum cinerariifolium]
MNEFYEEKGIKREYSVARTPYQNRVAERRNRTLIEAARTMLADSKLPTIFWVGAVNTTCYVKNRVLVVKPHFKTLYELFKENQMKRSLFDGKSDEEIFVGYSTTSKDFRVYNIRTRKVEKNLHINFLENKSMIVGGGPEWLFDIDALSKSMNYAPIPAGTNSNDFAGKGASFNADGYNKDKHGSFQASESDNQERPNAESSTKTINTAGPFNTATPTYADYPNDPLMPDLEDTGIFDDAYDDRDEGHRQEEGIDYDEVFALVARIEATMLFWAYESFMDFTVYQMDVKSAFLYGTIEEEVYVSQPPGFVDPEFPDRVYKVEKALYGLHQAPKAWYETLSTYLVDNGFRRGTTNKTLFIKEIKDDILLVQVFQMSSMGELTFFLGLQCKSESTPIETYNALSKDSARTDVDVHLYSVKTTSTPIETQKPLVKDEEAADVDVHLYRFEVTPKTSHLEVVKRIFRKSTTRVCQFIVKRLISWQCKKQTIVATYTTEAEYVAATHCCGQVLWIQNHLLDYWFNFMNTKIYIDNESTIRIVKKLVFHSKTKHIEIRHHFIRDAYENKLIQVLNIHTDDNVVDLLTKAFDVSKFNFLVFNTGLLNL